jgi:hypothetical protein
VRSLAAQELTSGKSLCKVRSMSELFKFWIPAGMGSSLVLFKALYAACDHEPTRHKLIEILSGQAPLVRRYHMLLDILLRRLQSLWGPPLSLRALLVCIGFAGVYTNGSFTVAHALGGQGLVAGIYVLDSNRVTRFVWPWIFLLCVTQALVIVWQQARLRRWISHFARLVLREHKHKWLILALTTLALHLAYWPSLGRLPHFDRGNEWLVSVSGVVTFLVIWRFKDAGVLAVLCWTFVPWAFLFAYGAGGGTWLAKIWMTSALAAFLLATSRQQLWDNGPPLRAGVNALLFVVLLAIAGGWYHGEPHVPTVALLILFVVAPALSGIADWMSWAVSRYFIKRARDSAGLRDVFGCLVMDVVTAAGVLVSLVLALPAASLVLNKVYGQYGGRPIDWVEFARAAHEAPWTKGLMVTLMMATTVVPTTLHVVVAVLSLLLRVINSKALIKRLQRMCDDSSIKKGNKVDPLITAGCIMCYLFVASLVVAGTGYACARSVGIPLGNYLYGLSCKVFLRE